jgi:hypothetical protein
MLHPLCRTFALAGAIFIAMASQSDAAGDIDPRCQSMRDKVRCTCALQNGGYIRGSRWYVGGPRGVIKGGGHRNAYYSCVAARGG